MCLYNHYVTFKFQPRKYSVSGLGGYQRGSKLKYLWEKLVLGHPLSLLAPSVKDPYSKLLKPRNYRADIYLRILRSFGFTCLEKSSSSNVLVRIRCPSPVCFTLICSFNMKSCWPGHWVGQGMLSKWQRKGSEMKIKRGGEILSNCVALLPHWRSDPSLTVTSRNAHDRWGSLDWHSISWLFACGN